MKQSDLITGSCLCGTVSFSVTLPSVFCAHCHCTMCQRNHGAGYVTWFGVPSAQLSIRTGEAELTRYQSSEHGTRAFCQRCGSSLFCESALHPDHVDIPLANMHAAIDRTPEFHLFFDDRSAWVTVGDDLPRLGGTTGVEPLGTGTPPADRTKD